MLINWDAIMGRSDRRRLHVHRGGVAGASAPVLGEGLISSGCGCFKGQRGRQVGPAAAAAAVGLEERGRAGPATRGWAAPRDFESRTGLLVYNKWI